MPHFTNPFPGRICFAITDSETATCPVSALNVTLPTAIQAASQLSQKSFFLGREVAKQALSDLGIETSDHVAKGPDGTPLWPQGTIGSISHSRKVDFIVAVAGVAEQGRTLGVGLDIEQLTRPVSEGFCKRVLTAREQQWVNSEPELKQKRAIEIFSAKESLYKAFTPIFTEGRTFHGAELVYDSQRKGFAVTILPEIPGYFSARSSHWVRVQESEGFVLTSVLLEK